MLRTLLPLFLILTACGPTGTAGGDDDSPGPDADPNAPDADPAAPDGGPQDVDAMPPPPATGDPVRLVRGTGNNQQVALAVAVDSDGSYVVVGNFITGIDVGTGFVTASPNNSYDAWIARFAADGTPQWTRALGTCDTDQYESVAVAADHTIWVGGMLGGGGGNGCNAVFDGQPLTTSGKRTVVAHYGAAGEELDIASFGQYNFATRVAVTADGQPVVAGQFEYDFDFGNGVTVTSSNPDHIGYQTFVASLDKLTLGARWATVVRDTSTNYFHGLGTLPGGDVVLAGDFYGSIATGAVSPLVSTGDNDVYVARYAAADGAHVWSKRFGGTDSDDQYCLQVAPDGDVVFAGTFQATSYFGGPAHTANGNAPDAYLARLTASGDYVTSGATSTTVTEVTQGCAADQWGNMVIAGYRSSNGFIAKTNASGTFVWDHELTTGGPRVQGIAVRPDGKVVAVGYFQGTMTVDGLPALTSNERDAFILVTEP